MWLLEKRRQSQQTVHENRVKWGRKESKTMTVKWQQLMR